MKPTTSPTLQIKNAHPHNLKNLSLHIPHHKLIVITGVSGSGKSSLAFELIAKEGQRRYFETLPSFTRQFLGKLNRPEVDEINGLSPVIAVGQRTSGRHARSTVGTLSDIYDLLRLLFARTGQTSADLPLTRALFSFNSLTGQCPRCHGIGDEEQIDLKKLVQYPERTIREGALAPTLPNGYIMYSQVTTDALNQVCAAEGFSVDIPWNELTDSQREVILYGSDKVKVPFGKHSLESRLKWTGIKAKPREEGYYKGMIPIMSDILRRDRNASILKYVHAVVCPACRGARLNETALSVTVADKTIAEVVRWELNTLLNWLQNLVPTAVAQEITTKINERVTLLTDLGLGHLTLDRPAASLRAGEIQRIRVANQILAPLSDVLYVFDEPSIGLHRSENARLIHHLKNLVRRGNTVIVVEHDLDTIRSADHLIELGPGAGVAGGELLFNGAFADFAAQTSLAATSPTYRALFGEKQPAASVATSSTNAIHLRGCHARNLQHIDVSFQLGSLNVVSGRSGAGKSSLVHDTLVAAVRRPLETATDDKPLPLTGHDNLDAFDKLVFIDHAPIGRTPRSNPATYLGISDHIRNLYAAQPAAKSRDFTKSRFSFNNKGGRCETCQGAGKTQIGMHFLGKVDLVCPTCNGDRFNPSTLEIKYRSRSIAEVYRLSITEALEFFNDQKKILAGLTVLQEIGLGYLTLGQSSTTLSGGEAQRIKIANHLQKSDTGATLYVLTQPSTGLHHADLSALRRMFDRIKKQGNTIVCVEQDETVIGWSDWHIELGPGSGSDGGRIVHQGPPAHSSSVSELLSAKPSLPQSSPNAEIVLNGVTTHSLQHIDVRIPKRQLTVVTGLSGSGKSALVYDTLYAEATARFTESLATFHRSFLQQNSVARLRSFSGLSPAIGMRRSGGASAPRSTVGTLTGIYATYRLLYSRIAQQAGRDFTAQHFSFNHQLGACPTCAGLGQVRRCDPDRVIIDPKKSILAGAAAPNRFLRYYTDPDGQFLATLHEVARQNNWSLDRPWQQLKAPIKTAILYGTGDTIWETTWKFSNKSRSGTQTIRAPWRGLCGYIDDEYQRKRHNKNIEPLQAMLHDIPCPTCDGSRLQAELLTVEFRGKNLYALTQLSIADSLSWLQQKDKSLSPPVAAIAEAVIPSVVTSLQTLFDLGLGYLTLDRAAATLSGGERQRVNLAGQLSARLYGVIYVLDEPSIGLDARQIAVLIRMLNSIVERGNTVVVIEHDLTFLQHADYLIELGPGAGRDGGQVVYQGKASKIAQAEHTLTYRLQQAAPVVPPKVTGVPKFTFGIKGARANNLQNIDVAFSAGRITAVTGVSGSGKSSLIKEVLYRSRQRGRPMLCDAVYGLDRFDEVLLIDQSPPEQPRNTTPAAYTGLLDVLKVIFAKMPAAKAAGLKRADFSYRSKGGRCPACLGHGQLKTSMDFLSDIWLTCDTCHGLRYNDRVLNCQLRGRSIGEVLQMTVTEAISFFEEQTVVTPLEVLQRVGIGHLRLGQAGNTLSGGEAQRLRLATALLQKRTGPTLYLFDEPSTGLHHFDILRLIEVFKTLIERGDTVLFIEHNAALIAAVHEIVRLGPGSGEDGGSIISQMTSQHLSQN